MEGGPRRDASDESTRPGAMPRSDANAAGGGLPDIFGSEMTAHPHKCAHCGNVGEVGTTRAWMDGPGIVLRCSICSEVVLRIVETPDGRYLDARGAAYVRLPK